MSDQPTTSSLTVESSFDAATPADILRALLARAELSQRGAAKLLGIDERTMRMWCAGQGEAPASVYRALDPRLTYSEYLRERIEENEQTLQLLESGRHDELPHAYRPSSGEATRQEIDHLRKRNGAYISILRLDERFHEMREALAVIFQQWLSPGSFGLTLASLKAFDAADNEFKSAKAAVDETAERIRRAFPLPYRR
jgi:hypothetical protein